MTRRWAACCVTFCILLAAPAVTSAQSEDECAACSCTTIEITEEPGGVKVRMLEDGGVSLQFDDSRVRGEVTPEAALQQTSDPEPVLAFALRGEGERMNKWRKDIVDASDFVPISDRPFRAERIDFGDTGDGRCGFEFLGFCDDFAPPDMEAGQQFAISRDGMFLTEEFEPMCVSEGQWALYEGSFRTLGIWPGVESVWRAGTGIPRIGRPSTFEVRIRTVATASLTMVKRSVPADGTDFTFAAGLADEAGRTEFTLDHAAVDDGDSIEDSFTLPAIVAGTYQVTEALPDGWVLGSATCTGGADSGSLDGTTLTVEVAPREDVVCVISNHVPGSATIALETDPAEGEDVSFSGDLGPFSLDDDADPTLPSVSTFEVIPGLHSVAAAVPAGWDVSAVACNDDDSEADPGTASAVLRVDPEEDLSCTFSLTQRGEVIAVLDMVPDDPIAVELSGDVGPFSLADGEASPDPASLAIEVPPGSYSIRAAIPPGWTATGLGCSEPGAVTDLDAAAVDLEVAPGGSFACTWTVTATEADLAIELDGGREPADPSRVWANLLVTNRGPAPATGVTVGGLLPAGLEIGESDCPYSVEDIGGDEQRVTWSLGTLAAQGTGLCNLTLRLPKAHDAAAQAQVSADQQDPDPTSNLSTLLIAAILAIPVLDGPGLAILVLMLSLAGIHLLGRT